MSDLHSGVESQTEEILHFSGLSKMVFFKKPHRRTEELRIGYRKGYSMDHFGTDTLQPTSQFKMADRLTQPPLGVAQHCSVLVFPLQKFLCWKFRNKALVYNTLQYPKMQRLRNSHLLSFQEKVTNIKQGLPQMGHALAHSWLNMQCPSHQLSRWVVPLHS